MKYLVCIKQPHKKLMKDMGFDNKVIKRIKLAFYKDYWSPRRAHDGICKAHWVPKSTPTMILDEDDFFALKVSFNGRGCYVAVDEDTKEGKTMMNSIKIKLDVLKDIDFIAHGGSPYHPDNINHCEDMFLSKICHQMQEF